MRKRTAGVRAFTVAVDYRLDGEGAENGREEAQEAMRRRAEHGDAVGWFATGPANARKDGVRLAVTEIAIHVHTSPYHGAKVPPETAEGTFSRNGTARRHAKEEGGTCIWRWLGVVVSFGGERGRADSGWRQVCGGRAEK